MTEKRKQPTPNNVEPASRLLQQIARVAVFLKYRAYHYRDRVRVHTGLGRNEGRCPRGYKKTRVVVHGEHYELIRIGGTRLHLHLMAFFDQRGIGRHARELAYQLRRLSLASGTAPPHTRDIFIFSTIHWCPETLPAHSWILLHDITPVILADLFPDSADYFRSLYKRLLPQAEGIITISDASRSDIRKLALTGEKDISVIENGVTLSRRESKPRIQLPRTPYFVFVGQCDIHKNLDVVFKAMLAAPDIQLVLIGEVRDFRKAMSSFPGLPKGAVTLTGRLSDPEMTYVVKRSLAMLFPSLYEGFGLPPLEAGALGVPSICSSRPAMTEVMAGAALFLDPHDPQAWADTMLALRDDPELCRRLGALARERSTRYRWQDTARKLVDRVTHKDAGAP